MRVLWIKTSSLGDVAHALYALSDPVFVERGIRFDWLVEPGYAPVAELAPSVERTIPAPLRAWRRRVWRAEVRVAWREMRNSIIERRYDLVIDGQGLLKSAVVGHRAARWSGARLAGPDAASAREGLASWFYHRSVAVPVDMHAIDRLRLLLARALSLPEPDWSVRVDSGFAAEGSGRRVLLLHGASREDKLWATEHWIQLARVLVQREYIPVLTWGSSREQIRAKKIAAASGAELLSGTSLQQLLPQLRSFRGFVGVDSGLSQLCATLGIAGVTLYGVTDPALVGTRGQNQRHLLGGDDVRPEEVCAALPF